MKVKVILMALAAASLSMAANAQDKTPEKGTRAGMHTTFARDKASDHWFIELQGGMGGTYGGYTPKGTKFMDRLSPQVAVGFGKWHSPYFATRLMATGWEVKQFSRPGKYPEGTYDESYNSKAKFVGMNLDFMLDLNNYFGIYSPRKVFHLIPFVGVGGFYKFAEDNMPGRVSENDWGAAVRGGLMVKFRLASWLDLNLEANSYITKVNFLSTNHMKDKGDLGMQFLGGLTFNLGKSSWEEIIPMDYALINSLNSQINTLRAENEELSKRPVSCPECPEATTTVEETKVTLDNVVYFRIGSVKIDKNQMVNIYNTAEYVKANNDKVIICGYADKETGNARINERLSEKRAKAVAKVLTDVYGIPADRIQIDWKGDTVQPYAENAWNRIVIMSTK